MVVMAGPAGVCRMRLPTGAGAGAGVGASVGLWWFGQSLTDCAPYIADARKLQLQLLGGGTGAERSGHDWQYLLGVTGLSDHDILLGNLARLTGGAIMLLAVAWGGWVLWQAQQRAGHRG